MLDTFYPCFKLGLFLACQEAPSKLLSEKFELEPDEDITAIKESRCELTKLLSAAEYRTMCQWDHEAAIVARRMITVWLDEVLIRSQWPGRKYWLRKPLQSDWGEGRSGGLWFFRQLKQLDPARQADFELAGLALRCISMGLTGCHGRSPENLAAARLDLQNRFNLKSDMPVFPPPMQPSETKRFSVNPAALSLLAALVFMVLLAWLGANFSLNRYLAQMELQSGRPGPLNTSTEPVNSLHGKFDVDFNYQ